MKRTTLGQSGISVSSYCLGTMTYGTQTPEPDAHAQIDRALDAGIDFLDTAKMYPVNPVRRETAGLTETIIGNWVTRTGRRGDLVIATKHSGHSGGENPIGPDSVRAELDASLKRLQTDYVDLYQFHWPNRAHYSFRRNWDFDPQAQPSRAEILENFDATMDVLSDLVAEGKMRAFGLSNETAWGTMQWLRASETGGPRVAAIQNEYSLMCRLYDTDLGELGHQENIALLAYSPLAAGLLSGKYRNGAVPEGSRATFGATLGGRVGPRAHAAVDAYLDVARAHGLDPVHMALAWTEQRPFPTIPIFGATTAAQLDHVIAGLEVNLDNSVLDAISKAHREHPLPY